MRHPRLPLQKEIAKAYKTLTDEEAKENWKKYGNPDGPGGRCQPVDEDWSPVHVLFSHSFRHCSSEVAGRPSEFSLRALGLRWHFHDRPSRHSRTSLSTRRGPLRTSPSCSFAVCVVAEIGSIRRRSDSHRFHPDLLDIFE